MRRGAADCDASRWNCIGDDRRFAFATALRCAVNAFTPRAALM